MEFPRPAATKLHKKLKNRMYRFAEKHSLTGFEAAGVMFALATEVMASALVRDGLLQGGPDFAEEAEEPEQDAPITAEAEEDPADAAHSKLLAVIDRAHGRIAQLEYVVREMARLAHGEIKRQRLAKTRITSANHKDLRARDAWVMEEHLRLTRRETNIYELLNSCDLNPFAQEPQS